MSPFSLRFLFVGKKRNEEKKKTHEALAKRRFSKIIKILQLAAAAGHETNKQTKNVELMQLEWRMG